MHDCDGATFDVHVRSGPIIEGCRDVTFRGEYRPDAAEAVAEGEADQNMYHDVKDFNWQRAGMKSPNFVVVPVLSPGLGVPPSGGGSSRRRRAGRGQRLGGDGRPGRPAEGRGRLGRRGGRALTASEHRRPDWADLSRGTGRVRVQRCSPGGSWG